MCRVNLDNVGTNGFQLLLMLDFVAGAIFIPIVLKCKDILPKFVTLSGLILNIIVMIPLCRENLDSVGTNAFQLILIVEVICCIIILVRTVKNGKKIPERNTSLNVTSLVVTVVCLLILFVTYAIGNLVAPKNMVSSKHESPTITENMESDDSQGIYTYQIRNYIGKNVASIGKEYGDYLIDEYGKGRLRIVFVSEDGMVFSKNDEIKKQYTVVEQNLRAGTNLTIVHLRDSKGRPYSNLVDYQSYEEIVLYVSAIGSAGYQPEYVEISPSLDRHLYYIRDYVGRNAASFGDYYGNDRVDYYGKGKLRISFTSEDGSFIDDSSEDSLKQYIVVSQDIKVNTELRLQYETDSKGQEYDNLIRSQNYEEINLVVRRLDEDVVNKMPELNNANQEVESSKTVELTVEYKVLKNGNAEITGFSGDGNHLTIDSKIDGHKVTSIGESAFKNCTTLENVIFWADIETIGDYAFYGCTSLQKISIPNETTYIGKHAFEKCTDLTSVILWGDPDIDDYAFADCSSLPSISIGFNTKEVGEHAFDGCSELSSATIWNDDTIIGKDAFANCPKLKGRPIQQ